MIEIKELLLKFDNILLGGRAKVESVRDTLFKITGMQIETKSIKIKDNIIYLDIKPIYKQEIFLKKDLILSKLKESLGKKSPSDIR